MKTSFLTILGICAFSAAAMAEDWPHWRGPHNDGRSSETNLPDKWSPKGENLLWRKEEFASRSSPVVMNDRVYLVCRAFPETEKEGEKTVCLDAKTGELIWESIHIVFCRRLTYRRNCSGSERKILMGIHLWRLLWIRSGVYTPGHPPSKPFERTHRHTIRRLKTNALLRKSF